MFEDLYTNLKKQREEEITKRNELQKALELEKMRRAVLTVVKSGFINEQGATNKYILDGFENTSIKIGSYENEIEEQNLKIKALDYQIEYIQITINDQSAETLKV